jgi:hypothetical protein
MIKGLQKCVLDPSEVVNFYDVSKCEEMRNFNLKHSEYFDFSQLNSIQSIKMHEVTEQSRDQCACAARSSCGISWSHGLIHCLIMSLHGALVEGLHRLTTAPTGSCLRSGFTSGLVPSGFRTETS